MILRWLLPLAALAAATLFLLSQSGAVVTEPIVSIDTDPTDNTATFVGTIDPCREVTVGPEFDIDVTIEQVTDLAGFEADLGYNPLVLQVTGVDYNYFLATAGPVTDWGETTPDTDGTFSMVAALFPLPLTGASGSGVLARVTLQAVASGLSNLELSYIKLSDINVQPIGDEDGDDYFDGPVANGKIAVDQSCSTPTPTATPTPTPTPEPDGDGDTVADVSDNCPAVANPADQDGDGSDGEDPVDSGDNDGDLLFDEDHEAGQEDVDGDGLGDACEDNDNDGFTDKVELRVGTSYADACAVTSDPNDEADDRWPLDQDDNQKADTADVLAYSGLVAPPTILTDPAFDRRLDLDVNEAIDTADVLHYAGIVAPPTSCAP